MHSPTVRVLTVLELLQSRERVTGAEIAERLEVHIRTVRLGAKNGKFTEIIAGVLPGEIVATKGSDVLRAELLKKLEDYGLLAECVKLEGV